jgi:hypothetical protein
VSGPLNYEKYPMEYYKIVDLSWEERPGEVCLLLQMRWG